VEWDQVRPGDYVKVKCGEIIPADILLLNSSEENSLCYVETATLDGENNLKEKYALTEPIRAYPHEFERLRGSCLVNAPCSNLYDFEGELVMEGAEPAELQYCHLVLRETVLKNTD
jgi:phospholipid-translocating ATPase